MTPTTKDLQTLAAVAMTGDAASFGAWCMGVQDFINHRPDIKGDELKALHQAQLEGCVVQIYDGSYSFIRVE